MKTFILSLTLIIAASCSFAQPNAAIDFTITTTDGVERNLFNTLDGGSTIMLDFFFTTCYYCIEYAPVIDEVYLEHGAGSWNFDIWGIDDGDNTEKVINYIEDYNIENPCASGTEGGGNEATAAYISEFEFIGWPTYTFICPDKHVYWDVNYPPTVNEFDSYFTSCGVVPTALPNQPKEIYAKLYSLAPNPAHEETRVSFGIDQPGSVSFTIYNVLGEVVLKHPAGNLPTGLHQYTLPINDLSSGSYLLEMNFNEIVLNHLQLSIVE